MNAYCCSNCTDEQSLEVKAEDGYALSKPEIQFKGVNANQRYFSPGLPTEEDAWEVISKLHLLNRRSTDGDLDNQ